MCTTLGIRILYDESVASKQISVRSPATSPGSLLGKARVTADVHTNNLIVIAEPAVQRLYADLIEKLGQPPPKVIIESRVVIIDTTDNFSLGVELSVDEIDGDKRLLTFSSFGLSEVDPVRPAARGLRWQWRSDRRLHRYLPDVCVRSPLPPRR